MTQPTVATPTPLEVFERAERARVLIEAAERAEREKTEERVYIRRARAQRAINLMTDLPWEDGYVRGCVSRKFLQEAAKASWETDISATAEAVALRLADYAEAVGLGVEFYVDDYNYPGDVDLRVEGLSCTLMVQTGPGLSPAYVIDGVGGWEQPDPWDARRWREIFQEVKEAFDAS